MLDKAETSLLLDYYGSFLTDRRRELMRMCADEDMSLSEIAEVTGVSRQGVRDGIAKGAAELARFEEQLGMAARDRQLEAVAAALDEAAALGDIAAMRAAVAAQAKRLRSLIR